MWQRGWEGGYVITIKGFLIIQVERFERSQVLIRNRLNQNQLDYRYPTPECETMTVTFFVSQIEIITVYQF